MNLLLQFMYIEIINKIYFIINLLTLQVHIKSVYKCLTFLYFIFHEQSDSEEIDTSVGDIEDAYGRKTVGGRPVANVTKRKREPTPEKRPRASTWREALGSPPSFGTTKVSLVIRVIDDGEIT